jgi:hypothetical protein
MRFKIFAGFDVLLGSTAKDAALRVTILDIPNKDLVVFRS